MNKEMSYFYFIAWLKELSLALGVTPGATFLDTSSDSKGYLAPKVLKN